MDAAANKSSAEIEREINEDRERIGERIEAIGDRLSPGQIVDEVLAYAKRSGGADFARNLGHDVKTNPIPVALMGASLAWLMASRGEASTAERHNAPGPATPEVGDYPLYPAVGTVRRVGPPQNEGDTFYSHFSDDSGKRLKALSDSAGNRAGHFMDEAGKTYRGFKDASGREIDRILDEAGEAFDAATGWTSATWERVKQAGSDMSHRASTAASSAGDAASSAANRARQQGAQLNDTLVHHFRDHPLVGAALAFAAGAAIGAALPSTETEDEAMGETATSVKKAGTAAASDLASETLERTADVATDVYETARSRVNEELDKGIDRS
ncbi:DUF3618 domain-containing protein [Rhizobium sp. L1K21]|uniref:DUF3618 domain-containing protein n=1 Tax=Rhizobium sp. L1K21 TaxID=2954933 RepID=UPI0020937C4F|nr:DUF3618 domain-containing protein [Rhizobium sp. L1K21]MCO6188629.1 DUF3618 domain-containing protein [Rhizobium sp. L1K21]